MDPPRRRGLLLLHDDRGSNLVEVSMAAFIMAVAVIGVIGAMGTGVGLVGHSRQRSAGVAVAQERLERMRAHPYENLALCLTDPQPEIGCVRPAHDPREGHPNNNVTDGDPPTHEVEPDRNEPLVLDGEVDEYGFPIKGFISHIDDPYTLGQTDFEVYQYVTWVNDPSITGTKNYKRITVVVVWKFPVHSGPSHRVVQSSLVGPGGVLVPPTPTPAADPSPTPAPEEPPPPIGDDNACGKLEILSGAGAVEGYTNTTTVQIRLEGTLTCQPVTAELSNDGQNFTEVVAADEDFPANVTWTIPPGDGSKTIVARFRNELGAESLTSGSLILDQSVPPAPSNMAVQSCSMTGQTRTVTMAWAANAQNAEGENFHGYRVYKSVDSAAFSILLTTGSTSASDTDQKGHASVRYLVRAYDKAGNESPDSNVLSFSKNSC